MKPKVLISPPAATQSIDIPAAASIPVHKVEACKPVCANCGKPLTAKVMKYCQDKAALFGGNLYCYDHQAAVKKA